MTNPVNFLCHSLYATAAELSAFGIALCTPMDEVVYRFRDGILMAEIGALVVIGSLIQAIPRHDCTERQIAYLRGAAEAAFHSRPCKAEGWRFSRAMGGRWTTYVSIPVPSDDPVSQAVRWDRRCDDYGERAA